MAPIRLRIGRKRPRSGLHAVAFILFLAVVGCEQFEWAGTPIRDRDSSEAPTPTAAADLPTSGPATAPVASVGAGSREPIATAERVEVVSRSELTALAGALDVPVAGVARSQLHDTFTEARGGGVHEALDILAARGTAVVSATDGRVLKIFDSEAGGLMVYAADPTDRFILLYGHLDAYAEDLREGMPLERGQVIGYVGTTGNAPPGTPHLHFGILRGDPSVSWWTGEPVNPYPLLFAAEPLR